jgi:hypothetical protein
LGLVYNIVIEDLILYNIEDVVRLPWFAVAAEYLRSKTTICFVSILIVAFIARAVLYIIIGYALR